MTGNLKQSHLEFSCGAGLAKVNLKTGELLFQRADIHMGANSFAVGVGHIYDKNLTLPAGISTYAGNNWRLNVQEFIRESGENYVYYYDGNGQKHEFLLYYQNGTEKKYYDTTGLNLTLWVKGSTRYIEDLQGNRLVFNSSGRLVEVVTLDKLIDNPEYYNPPIGGGLGGGLVGGELGQVEIIPEYINIKANKTIEYSNNMIQKICDPRKASRILNFTYTNGFLECINCMDGSKSKYKVFYDYDQKGNLTGVNEYSNSDGRFATLFKYDSQNRLIYAVSCQDRSALRFEYSESDGKVKKVSVGVMKIEPILDGKVTTTFCSEETFAGDDVYCGGETDNLIGFKISDNASDFHEKNHTGFEYLTSSTVVTNEKEIAIEYFFNTKGYTTGILERRNGSATDLMTLTKDSGKKLFDYGNVLPYINNTSAMKLSENSYTINEARVMDYVKSTGVSWEAKPNDNDTSAKNYVVSFWAKLSSAQSSMIKAKIKTELLKEQYLNIGDIPISSSTESFDFRGTLDNSAVNAWQYVAIPITLDVYYNMTSLLYYDNKTLSQMVLIFENLSDDNEIEIANLRIAPNNSPIMRIANYPINEIKQIKYIVDGLNYTKNISSDFFMSENDFIQTYRNVAKNLITNNNTLFEITACDSTKRIAKVTSLKLTFNDNNTAMLSMPNGEANYKFMQETPDKKARTETTFKYFTDKITQTTSAYYDREFKSSAEVTADLKGKIIEEVDEYGVKTEYSYDNYDNPTTTTITCSNEETLTYDNTYTPSSPVSSKEYLTKVTGNDTFTSFEYYDPKANLKKVTSQGGWTNEYSYDGFGRLDKVYLKDSSGSVQGQNCLTYDENGRLGWVNDGGKHSYKFKYNDRGDVTSYNLQYYHGNTLCDKKMLEKEYEYDDNTLEHNAKVTERIYSSDTGYSATTTTLNKYNMPTLIQSGSNATGYTYQTVNESPSVAKVAEVYDPYESKGYSYSYDDENRPCGYKITSHAGTSDFLTVQQTADNRTKYSFDGDSFETEVLYDEEKMMSPKIEKTINFVDGEQLTETSYNYDKLGRLKSKVSSKDSYPVPITTSWFIENYWENTSLIKNLTTNHYWGSTSGSIHYTSDYTYGYDERNNVQNISETFTKEIIKLGPSTTTSSQSISYTYDGGDKVKTEVNTALDINYEYKYNKRGQLTEVWNRKVTPNVRVKLLKYDDFTGRLLNAYTYDTVTYKNTYTYNNYGNVTSITSSIGSQPYPHALSWTRGKYLSSYLGNSYSYNHQGVRFRKIVNGITTNYYLDGSKILGENRGTNKLRYFYDACGLSGFSYNGALYYYGKDALGNITKIYKNDGLICHYYYDAFGNCKALDANGTEINKYDTTHIANINPFRWKSHYFDFETGWYYIDSRYYDPNIGQYIDADSPEALDPSVIGGLDRNSLGINPVISMSNMHSFYSSIPLTVDPNSPESKNSWLSRFFSWYNNIHWGWKIGIGTAFIVAGLIATVVTGGAFLPALAATAKAVGISMAISASMGAIVGGITGGWQGALNGAIDGAIDGYMWGGIYAGTAQMLGAMSPALRAKQVIFTDNKNWMYGNRNSFETTILRVNNAGKQVWRLDAGAKYLFHLHYGAGKAMRIHR